MAVHRIEDPHIKKIEEVLGDLFDVARSEGASSLLFVMETPRRRTPVVGAVGRLRADPRRAIGELALLKQRLVKLAAAPSC